MILFTILALIALILTILAVTILSVGGTAFIVIFGDIIVCVVLIALLIKFLAKRKK